MIITHNLSAMQTNRSLQTSNRMLSKSLEKLSSGYRINVGADDPSGLVISEQLRSQIGGVTRAIQNTSEASNLIGLTEGALSEMNEILKKMRALAIHAANSGITSPEQVKANQSEVDSGIATIERIANSTRYSDQFLLNGSKSLIYDRTTQVKTTMDHTLINTESSRVDQIFKRAGVAMTFAYNGVDSSGYVNNANQAMRAYLEADSIMPDPHDPGGWVRSPADLDENGRLTAQQEFILTGTKGTRLFRYIPGTPVGQIAQEINNVKDSLGIGATLIFSANARVDQTASSTFPMDYLDWSSISDVEFGPYDTSANPFFPGLMVVNPNYDPLFPAVDPPTIAAEDAVPPLAFTFAGKLENPNDLARRLGLGPDSDPASATPPINGTATVDMHVTLVPPQQENGMWVISIGTAVGANDLFETAFRPDASATLSIGQGPLAGLELSFNHLLARNPGFSGIYSSVLPASGIQYEGATFKPGALVDMHRQTGEVQIYGANINGGPNAIKASGVTVGDPSDFRPGLNCDGDGRVYAKVVKFVSSTDYEVEWYKDKDCTMLIGTSSRPNTFSATNNSGIRNGGLTIALTNNAVVGDVYTIGLIGQEFTPARDSDGFGGLDQPADFDVSGLGGWQGMNPDSLSRCVMSGVNLGFNTSADGSLWFRAEGPPDDRIIRVYKDARMTPASMVAEGRANLSETGQRVIRLEEVRMENGLWSGFNMTIPFGDVASNGLEVAQINFTNVGLRLYSTEYGSNEYINIQNRQGTLFHEYRFADSIQRDYVAAGTTVRSYGQDAVLSLNGFPIRANGVTANVTTADFSGQIAYNAGTLGLTTLAVAGYEIGSLVSRAGALQGIAEDESRMRQVQLGQGYTIHPAITRIGPVMGLSTGKNPEVWNDGQFTLDFSNINMSGWSDHQVANLEAALKNGIRIEVAPTSDIGPDGMTTTVLLGLYFTDRNGIERLVDLGSTTAGAAYLDPADGISLNGEAIPFTTLNNPDGIRVMGGHSGLPEFDGLFAGLIVKANNISNSLGVSSAPRTMYDVSGHLERPGFDPLTQVVTYATNARHSTSETLDNFIGGMQFQLGGNEGDQDRTVYSIPSMVMANIGRVEVNGRIYTLQDVLGSSDASLVQDPILAMTIIAKAVDDVTTLRGRLGAFQANMLLTNQNSLTIAVEMLAKTESAIRDTDMAAESTEFTKNQIMMQAGTAMLAQANTISQSVLQLLG